MDKEYCYPMGNITRHVEDTSAGDIETVADPQYATGDAQGRAPVWESRRTYTKSGLVGLFSSRYVLLCALFATLGGLLFGYDQGVVSITLVMPQFLDEFPDVSPDASGAGFKKGLMTAILELGAFLGKGGIITTPFPSNGLT